MLLFKWFLQDTENMLLNFVMLTNWIYKNKLVDTIKTLLSRLRFCSQFMKKQQFEVLVGNLMKARQLKRRIQQLKHYRMNGITKLEG